MENLKICLYVSVPFQPKTSAKVFFKEIRLNMWLVKCFKYKKIGPEKDLIVGTLYCDFNSSVL